MHADPLKARTVAVGLIKVFEGYRRYAYPDPASELARATPAHNWGLEPGQKLLEDLPAGIAALSGDPWTVGHGQTGVEVGPTTEMPPEAAEEALDRVLKLDQNLLRSFITEPMTANEEGALLSLGYNIGMGALRHSTLVRHFNQGLHSHASGQFLKWVNAGGRKLNGLVKRRQAEQRVFNTP